MWWIQVAPRIATLAAFVALVATGNPWWALIPGAWFMLGVGDYRWNPGKRR